MSNVSRTRFQATRSVSGHHFYILDCHFLFLFFVFYVFVLLQGDISISSTRADVSLVSTGAKSEASFGSRTSKSSRKSVHHIQGQFYGAKLSAGAAVGLIFCKLKGDSDLIFS